MRMKRARLDCQAMRPDALRQRPLQRNRGLRAGSNAQPENVGGAARWKHADFPKLQVERHVRQVAADVLNNRSSPSRIDFAEKHECQMHLIRTYPFDRPAA